MAKHHKGERVLVATDGSYQDGRIGYGVVIAQRALRGGYEIVCTMGGEFNMFPESRQIGGEVQAVLMGLAWCVQNDASPITLIYDYKGVAEWAHGRWAGNKPVAQYYIAQIRSYEHLDIIWEWTPGHQGHPLNELADDLARGA